MREQILEAIYDFWSEKNGGIQPEVRAAMENIRKEFSLTDKDFLLVESEVLNATNASERVAFIEGFLAGADVVSGRIFCD